MSDSHLHHHLSPQSIRFCPLCGGPLERRAVPSEGKREMVCAGANDPLKRKPPGSGGAHDRASQDASKHRSGYRSLRTDNLLARAVQG